MWRNTSCKNLQNVKYQMKDQFFDILWLCLNAKYYWVDDHWWLNRHILKYFHATSCVLMVRDYLLLCISALFPQRHSPVCWDVFNMSIPATCLLASEAALQHWGVKCGWGRCRLHCRHKQGRPGFLQTDWKLWRNVDNTKWIDEYLMNMWWM